MTSPAAAAHYSWSTVPLEQLNPQLSRRIVTGAQVMVAHVYLKTGCIVPKHHHVNEQVTYILEGALRFWLGDKVDSQDLADSVEVASGQVLVIPGNVPHRAIAPRTPWTSTCSRRRAKIGSVVPTTTCDRNDERSQAEA